MRYQPFVYILKSIEKVLEFNEGFKAEIFCSKYFEWNTVWKWWKPALYKTIWLLDSIEKAYRSRCHRIFDWQKFSLLKSYWTQPFTWLKIKWMNETLRTFNRQHTFVEASGFATFGISKTIEIIFTFIITSSAGTFFFRWCVWFCYTFSRFFWSRYLNRFENIWLLKNWEDFFKVKHLFCICMLSSFN